MHTQQESLGRLLAVVDERQRMLETQRDEVATRQSRLEEDLALQQGRFEAASAEATRTEAEAEEASRQALAARQRLQHRLTERQAEEEALEAARQALSALENRKVLFEARLAERIIQQEKLLQAIVTIETEIDQAKSEQRLQRKQADADQQSMADADAAREQSENDLEAARHQLGALESERQKTRSELQKMEAELARLAAQADVLEQAESEMVGYAEGAKLLLNAARRNRLRASSQSLGAQLEIRADLETAIAAALGEYMDSVLLERTAGTDEALDLLSGKGARGVLLPLDGIHPAILDISINTQENDGYFGLASELVTCIPSLRPAVDLVLGRTLIVRDRQSARLILSTIINRAFSRSSQQ